MKTPKIFESEYRFCLILWKNEPITCANISVLCREQLGWSRTTTYTVIKRLEERGFLKRDGSIITSLFSKEQIQISEMDELITKTFEGSLPSFIAAFAKKQNLSQKDLDEIQKILNK
ncbi:MAG: BlaI/MecI/CopY family transcriptional regulator [Acutalibacteraceae bacterium]